MPHTVGRATGPRLIGSHEARALRLSDPLVRGPRPQRRPRGEGSAPSCRPGAGVCCVTSALRPPGPGSRGVRLRVDASRHQGGNTGGTCRRRSLPRPVARSGDGRRRGRRSILGPRDDAPTPCSGRPRVSLRGAPEPHLHPRGSGAPPISGCRAPGPRAPPGTVSAPDPSSGRTRPTTRAEPGRVRGALGPAHLGTFGPGRERSRLPTLEAKPVRDAFRGCGPNMLRGPSDSNRLTHASSRWPGWPHLDGRLPAGMKRAAGPLLLA